MREIGNTGEKIAEAYLKNRGARILAKNFAVRGGEIDLIAELEGTVVFVEVKLRGNERFGSVYESITPAKQKHICRAAHVYLQRNGLTERFARYDAILIDPEGNIDHIERAFDDLP